jgi:transcriptional regulator with XRE-family HTH domain
MMAGHSRWKTLQARRLAEADDVREHPDYEQAGRDLRLGDQLRAIRRSRNLTQKEVAERAGISQPALSRIELGGGVPDIETLRRLGNAMGVRFHVIVGNEEAEHEENLLVSLAKARFRLAVWRMRPSLSRSRDDPDERREASHAIDISLQRMAGLVEQGVGARDGRPRGLHAGSAASAWHDRPSSAAFLHTADRFKFFAAHPGQHGDPCRTAAVQFAEQFPHPGLHLLASGVQIEGHRSLKQILLAHVHGSARRR